MKRHLWLLACLSALMGVGCGSDPSKPDQPEVHNPKVPAGSTIAVVMFRDCTIPDQEDCDASGYKTTGIFVSQLSNAKVFRVETLSRPVAAKAELSDDAAVAYAKQKGYAYVMNGEVTDYYKAAPFTGAWHKERAAIAVRVLSTADGKIIYVHSDSDTGANIKGSPDGLFKDMAEDVQNDLEDN